MMFSVLQRKSNIVQRPNDHGRNLPVVDVDKPWSRDEVLPEGLHSDRLYEYLEHSYDEYRCQPHRAEDNSVQANIV